MVPWPSLSAKRPRAPLWDTEKHIRRKDLPATPQDIIVWLVRDPKVRDTLWLTLTRKLSIPPSKLLAHKAH